MFFGHDDEERYSHPYLPFFWPATESASELESCSFCPPLPTGEGDKTSGSISMVEAWRKRGQMTISPPAKVKLSEADAFKVLGSGIDSLVVAINVKWKSERFFEYLDQMKDLAVQNEQEQAIQFPDSGIFATIKPYGRKGHQWIVSNNDFELSIGNWLQPKTRPSVMATFRSEALWRIGPQECVEMLKEILFQAGAESFVMKPSRVDICLDMTFQSQVWTVELLPFRVTKAHYAAPHYDNAAMTGISIGKGIIGARLYDKALEIRKKSKKYWMFDIWDIDEDIPETLKVIRIEGQFRREGLKDLGLDTLDDLFNHIEKLWAYFTQQWLKFESNPGAHHTMRKTLPWWMVVQNGFLGLQKPTPLIRCKAIQPQKKQLLAQTLGTATSYYACIQEENDVPIGAPITIGQLTDQLKIGVKEDGKNEFELEIELANKRAKRARMKEKMQKTHLQRILLGHPSNLMNEE